MVVRRAALLHLAEECGELTHAVTKIARILDANPKARIPKSLLKHLSDEAGDVFSLIKLLTERGLIDKARVSRRVAFKSTKYERNY